MRIVRCIDSELGAEKGGGGEGMGMQVHLVRYVIWRDSAHIKPCRLARQHKLVAVQQTVIGTALGSRPTLHWNACSGRGA